MKGETAFFAMLTFRSKVEIWHIWVFIWASIRGSKAAQIEMDDDITGDKDQRDSPVHIGQKGLIGVIQI